ncbi:hypothetical protein, partial [Blautia wexlerae]|uniref:hypothetical protein n=2 Tax=Blautia wexlerae TaxID=418240 RepID=UPI00325C1B08
KYPEQVAEPESCVTVRIFLFGAVSSKKRYLPTAPCFIYNSYKIACRQHFGTWDIISLRLCAAVSKLKSSEIPDILFRIIIL